MAAYGLYTHIRANRIRSGFLIVGLFLLVWALTFAGALIAAVFTHGDASLGYLMREAAGYMVLGIPLATAGTLIWLIFGYQFHQSLIDAQTGAHGVTREAEPRLYNLLENLCISRGIPTPKLQIVEDNALNAYATGLNQKQYSIAVTRGLLNRLDDQEIEAVLGHELTHIRNGDVKLLVIAVVLAGIISFVGELIFRGLFRTGGSTRWRSSSSGDRKGGGGAMIAILIALAIIALAWIFSIVIRFALSRSREYLADAGAVELTKNPDAMITALRKIENRGELKSAPSSVMEMCIDNPHSGFVDLFSTHPAIEKRVEALVRTAGGRDPGPIALPEPDAEETAQTEETAAEPETAGPAGPWGLPDPRQPVPAPQAGPWAQPATKPDPWRL
jgi:heat shock protein HtpX